MVCGAKGNPGIFFAACHYLVVWSGGLEWWFGFGFELLVLVEGKWETLPESPNHKLKPPAKRKQIKGAIDSVRLVS